MPLEGWLRGIQPAGQPNFVSTKLEIERKDKSDWAKAGQLAANDIE